MNHSNSQSLTAQAPLSNTNQHPICIIGHNAKSVAAATALTHFGFHVLLLGLSDTADNHVRRYQFDTHLCNQWQSGLDAGVLQYQQFSLATLEEQNHSTYWLFLDQLSPDLQEQAIQLIDQKSADVFFSGIVEICNVQCIAQSLTTANIFYIPFVFLHEASIYDATISPKFLLVGEKTPQTASKHPVIQAFLTRSSKSSIASIMTIELTRSCMMNLVANKLTLINKMSRLADACHVDMLEVKSILSMDERLGSGFLQSGWGYGGSSLPKENTLLKSGFDRLGLSAGIIEEVEKINEDQKELIFRKLWCYFKSDIDKKTVLIWGAGYKAGTGRTKGGAIHALLPILWGHQVSTHIYDTLAENDLMTIYDGDTRLQFTDSAYDKLNTVDALIILNWSDDATPDIKQVSHANIPVFDARNLLTRSDIEQLDAYYTGIGRGIG